MTDFAQRYQSRQQQYMSGLDLKEQLCRKEEFAVELRKEKREKQVRLRRALISNLQKDPGEVDMSAPAPEKELGQLYPALTSGIPVDSKVELLCYLLGRHETRLETLQALRLMRQYFSGNMKGVDLMRLYRDLLVHEALWYLYREDLEFQNEAAWLLSNLLSKCSPACREVLGFTGELRLIQLLNSENEDLAENVLFALGNIAGECCQTCQKLISQGAHDAVVAAIRRHANSKPVTKVGSWVLCNLLRYPTDVARVRTIAEALLLLRKSPYGSVRKQVLLAIQHISAMRDEHISLLFSFGLIQPLITQFAAACSQLAVNIVKVFVDVSAGGNKVNQSLLELGVLDKLHARLNDPTELLRVRCIEVLANITAGEKEHVSLVVNHPVLREALGKIGDCSVKVKLSVARLLSNISRRGTWDHIVALISFGVIATVKQGLEECDSKALLVSLT